MQALARARESVADRGDGFAEDVADLLQRQTLVVVENEDFAEVGLQLL